MRKNSEMELTYDQLIQAGVRVKVTISAAVPAERDMQVDAIRRHRKEYIMVPLPENMAGLRVRSTV